MTRRRHISLAIVVTSFAMLAYHTLLPSMSVDGAGNETTKPARDNEAAETDSHPNVIIVGAGISGLSAALELGRGGANVTVVDMSSVFGGHAVMSQGGVSVVDTPVQRESGWEDSPKLAQRDLIEWGEDADPDWVKYYTRNSRRDIYEWLTELGVRFESVLPAPGNSVDRFHQPAGRGIGLVAPLYRECLKHSNIRFLWNLQATKLLQDGDRVTGVRLLNLRENSKQSLKADAVVLATGGFQSNLDMVREFWPTDVTFPEKILAGSGRNSVGRGHRLAQASGAELVKMDHQWNYFTGIPDPRQTESNHGLSAANMHGILVNPQGQRFANLHNWAKEVMPPMLRQKRVTVWFVFDEATKSKFTISGSDWADFKKVERLVLDNPVLVAKADTIIGLAEKTGLPAANLAATIARYNSLVEKGRDEDFGRFGPDRSDYNNTASPKLETPPYYAMQSWPLTRKSMGGVAIDLQCRVLTRSKTPIPGLYAVGELTGLAGINGKAALEGTFLGPCIVTGRVAARSILGAPAPPVTPLPATSERCIDCHDVESLVKENRKGYWHFEKSHRVVLERELACLLCHAELAPYDEDFHQMNQLALTASCASCHIAQE